MFVCLFVCLFVCFSIWPMWSPFSPDQTWLDLQLSRLEVFGVLLQVSPSTVAL